MTSRSIQNQLQFWLLVPLCSLAVVSTIATYALTKNFSDQTYDEIMVNSADSVATRVKMIDGKIIVDLPPAAQDILEHNDTDKFYYQVVTSDGKQVSGDAHLPFPQDALSLAPWKSTFRNANVDGQEVRLGVVRMPVSVAKDGSLWIVVAETLKSRRAFANHIIWSVVLPQIFLIILGAATVSLGVSRGLGPLKRLRQSLDSRSQSELTPIVNNDFPTEISPVVKALNDLLVRLRDDLEAQQRFASNAAHQLKTPIAGLKTYLGLLNRARDMSEAKEIVGQLDLGMDRLDRLVNSLLALSRVERTMSNPPVRDPIDLNDLAHDVARISMARAKEKDVEVNFTPACESALVLGDPVSLQELVFNLVENAILYTPIGGYVQIGIIKNGTVDLFIMDNGPGIPISERDRVFERFYRVLGTGVEGNGLGLSIVNEIARVHGAVVCLANAENDKGTRVTVQFKPATAALTRQS